MNVMIARRSDCGSSALGARWMVALVLTACACVANGEDFAITLTPMPEKQRLAVEIVWGTSGRTQSVLETPQRFGDCDDVPGLLENVEFGRGCKVIASGRRWRIEHPKNHTIECRYEVKCVEKIERDKRFFPAVTRDYAHLIGNTFLLAPAEPSGSPKTYDVALRWKLPAGWKKAVCSWGEGLHLGLPIRPSDMQHSVFLAGKIDVVSVPVGRAASAAVTVVGEFPALTPETGLGESAALTSQPASMSQPAARAKDVGTKQSVTVALAGRYEFSPAEFAGMVCEIVAHQRRFMDDDAFPPFIVTAVPYGDAEENVSSQAGTGLFNSFAAFLTPNSRINDALEHLLAHEMFHYWNGRILDRDPPEEYVYWFSEGFTDYYALRILLESGRWDAATFCKWVNRHIADYQRNPARNASNDEIKAGFWSQRETVGQVAYERGLLLGLRWHELARDKGVTDGVDKLFRGLVERARASGFKLSNAKIRAVGAEALGAWFKDDFDLYVERAETIDVPLDALRYVRVTGARQLVGERKTVYRHDLGFDSGKTFADQRVTGLKGGSAAERAGLREGDELLGWSVFGDPDRKAELTVKRDGKKKTISYFPRGEAVEAVQFSMKKAGGEKGAGKP